MAGFGCLWLVRARSIARRMESWEQRRKWSRSRWCWQGGAREPEAGVFAPLETAVPIDDREHRRPRRRIGRRTSASATRSWTSPGWWKDSRTHRCSIRCFSHSSRRLGHRPQRCGREEHPMSGKPGLYRCLTIVVEHTLCHVFVLGSLKSLCQSFSFLEAVSAIQICHTLHTDISVN